MEAIDARANGRPRTSVCVDHAALSALCAEYTAAGRAPSESPDPLDRSAVHVIRVDDPGQIEAVVDLAARGSTSIVLSPTRTLAAEIYDQCRRLTAAEWFDAEHRPVCDGLRAVHLDLLMAVRSGDDMAAAARRCHLSLRTAARRMTEARGVLGARSTAEAVAVVGRRIDQLRCVG